MFIDINASHASITLKHSQYAADGSSDYDKVRSLLILMQNEYGEVRNVPERFLTEEALRIRAELKLFMEGTDETTR